VPRVACYPSSAAPDTCPPTGTSGPAQLVDISERLLAAAEAYTPAMGGSEPQGGGDQYSLFLLEGLLRNPSPVILLVTDRSAALSLAQRFHAGSVSWDELPAPSGSLLAFETGAACGLTSQTARDVCAELAASTDWLYIEDVEELLESAGGSYFFTTLLDHVAGGDIAAVIVSTQPDNFSRLRSNAVRLLGFATVFEHSDGTGGLQFYRANTYVRPAQDRSDTGWMVAVRLDLTSPITPDADFTTDPAIAAAMELVSTVHVIGFREADQPPDGVMIGLKPDAFLVTQHAAAFATATMAAQRVIGRTLYPGENVIATRALYYA